MARLNDIFRTMVKFYARTAPFNRGKGRLIEATRAWTTPGAPIRARVGDGYMMELDLSDLVQRSIYFRGYYEPEFARFLRTVLTEGDTFVDCGANVGQFSIIAARRVGPAGRVISIEPEPRNYAQLQTNLTLNKLDNVTPLQTAIGDCSGSIDFFVRGAEGGFTNRGVHSLHPHNDWLNPDKITVPIGRLDNILKREPRVNVIKMDIEGAELDALKGAGSILERFSPLIFFEANEICTRYFGRSTVDVKSWLRLHGYLVLRFRETGLTPAGEGPESDSLLVAVRPSNKAELESKFNQ